MLATYRGAHAGSAIAVLGSGPTLGLFTGQQPVAIAVNGAATHDVRYQYFICGDSASPWQEWFYGSRQHAARRIVASFVAPRDVELFPARHTRVRLRLERLRYSLVARRQGSITPLYDYTPRARPASGHGWFQYTVPNFPAEPGELFDTLQQGRVAHGATIAGVAVQFAYVMGAAAIHLYGCTMDNDSGGNYHRPGSGGRTTPTQRAHFSTLTDWIERAGVAVVRHAG